MWEEGSCGRFLRHRRWKPRAEAGFTFPPGAVRSHKAISFLSLLEGIVMFLHGEAVDNASIPLSPVHVMAAFHTCSPTCGPLQARWPGIGRSGSRSPSRLSSEVSNFVTLPHRSAGLWGGCREWKAEERASLGLPLQKLLRDSSPTSKAARTEKGRHRLRDRRRGEVPFLLLDGEMGASC